MRMRDWLLAGAALMAMEGAASAQQQASSFFTGVQTTQVRNVPLDTTRAVAQHPAQSALTSNRFDFSALFKRLTIPSFPAQRGVSALPPPSSFPSTRYQSGKTVGTPPYPIRYMFGGDKSPITPVAPIIPTNNVPVGPGSG